MRIHGWSAWHDLQQSSFSPQFSFGFSRMKTTCVILSLLIAGNLILSGAQSPTPLAHVGKPDQKDVPAPTPYRVVGRGANQRVWQHETYEKIPSGQIVPHIHKYTELATGMHHTGANGKWVESKEEIEAFAGGAIARQGQYQVVFANNLNSAGAIDLQTPDQKRLRSNILGLMYHDTASDNAVLIAQIQDSTGQLIAPNQVLYPNAFQGVNADVRYTYKKGSFEQDVILHEQLPSPTTYGMNPATTEVEVMTEFISPPAEHIATRKNSKGAGVNQTVSWGAMSLGQGKAFNLNGSSRSTTKVPVTRQYETVQGRKILLEKVPIVGVQSALKQLRQHASATLNLPKTASRNPILPPPPVAQSGGKPIQYASITPKETGYVLDYIELNTDQSDFTFQGDTTYYISADVNFSGTTTFEGGTVIKYNTSSTVGLNILGDVNCATAPYRPAVFTSYNDNSVGEGISGGGSVPCTGSLALHVQNDTGMDIGYLAVYDANTWDTMVYDYGYGSPAISSGSSTDYSFTAGLGEPYYFDAYDIYWNYECWGEFNPTLNSGTVEIGGDWSCNYSESGDSLCTTAPPTVSTALTLANGGTLHDLRISGLGLGIETAANCSLMNVQFVNCATALSAENASLYVGNILMSHVSTGFSGQNFQVTAENMTFDQGNNLTVDQDISDTSSSVSLVNSLLTGVLNLGVVPVTTNGVANLPDNAGVYQTVCGAGYYLATDSPYHNCGTTGINASLLSALGQQTTYPPIVYSDQTISVATTLSPQAHRDNVGNPDLGYHYYPLDYAFGGCEADCNLTFTPGTSVGWFRTSSGWYHSGHGIWMNGNITVGFNGTAASPDYFVRLNTVQEADTTAGYGHGGIENWYTPNIPIVSGEFLRCTVLAGEGFNGYFSDDYGEIQAQMKDSEFWSGALTTYCDYMLYTNCLMWRVYVALNNGDAPGQFTMRNCTMLGGVLSMNRDGGAQTPALVHNSSFDGTTIGTADYYGINVAWSDYNYNAYTNGSDPFSIGGINDVIMPSGFNWQSGLLGNFYLPTNSPLINKGSTTADQVGLYHFTTQTNEVKEANSIVDIGYHYVATDAYGNALDSNGDGVPDYLEDANGDGLADNGEIAWDIAILVQPAGRTVRSGDTMTFSVIASGLPLLRYQWKNNGTNIMGGTNSIYVIPDVSINAAGNYSVAVTNAALHGLVSSNALLSVSATNRLGYWSFDNTNTWVGSAAQLPMLATNVIGVSSWNTNAVLIDSTNISILKYRDVETNGNANINLRNGAVRFWFKPDWSSGIGPGNAGSLIEMGNQTVTNGWWALVLNVNGSQLTFGTKTNGLAMTNLAATINWNSNQWHQIVLTYTPTNSVLYLDGQVSANGAGSIYYPNLAIRTNGFTLGSSASGTNQARGTIDELETFNYPLSPGSIYTNCITILPKTMSGLTLWLAADHGISCDSSNRINEWFDQSGNTNNATQGNSGNQPLYTTNSLNGLPVVRFNGTNSYFSLPPSMMNGAIEGKRLWC